MESKSSFAGCFRVPRNERPIFSDIFFNLMALDVEIEGPDLFHVWCKNPNEISLSFEYEIFLLLPPV